MIETTKANLQQDIETIQKHDAEDQKSWKIIKIYYQKRNNNFFSKNIFSS